MATENAPIAPDQPSSATTNPEPAARRTVTLPVLPLAIVAAVVVAILFFGGGVALGYSLGDHPGRLGTFQPYGGIHGGEKGENGQNRLGGQNGLGQNGGQHGGLRPNDRPSGAPKNG